MFTEAVVVKKLPECQQGFRRNSFLSELRNLAQHTYRPRLVVDLSDSPSMKAESLDLLLDCVEQMDHADGRVSLAAASPEAEVILELTRLTSVVDVFPSVSDAVESKASNCVVMSGKASPQERAA
jgi:anti-anti-sigma factor